MRWKLLLAFIAVVCVFTFFLIHHPKSPLPDAWNPVAPLSMDHPITPLTHWKLNHALRNTHSCQALLSEALVDVAFQEDFEASPICYIRGRVALSGVGDARMTEVSTRCAIAARLAFWERHGLQPASQKIFGEGVAEIHHMSSYSCRPMRTGQGVSFRMSTHATADAIDISGFTLTSGRRINLLEGWDGAEDAALFLREARDTACDWFRLTLSPDYNALHADHFHVQSVGPGSCR